MVLIFRQPQHMHTFIMTGFTWNLQCHSFICRLGSSVGIAIDYGLDDLGIESLWGKIFCLFRPALGPTQPPV